MRCCSQKEEYWGRSARKCVCVCGVDPLSVVCGLKKVVEKRTAAPPKKNINLWFVCKRRSLQEALFLSARGGHNRGAAFLCVAVFLSGQKKKEPHRPPPKPKAFCKSLCT